jgi:2-polyprenyl-3-methyl-5-hydroxy-6-metoxy-1,4-benzoquinol methylase
MTKMKKDPRNKAEKFWDRTASNYDKEEKKDEKIYLQIIEKLKSYLKTSDIVLGFGCGTGLVSNEIAKSVKKIHAIDLSLKMIEIAKTKAEKQKILNIEYAHATIFDDSLKLGSYDVILSFYILHLLEDPQVVIKKIHKLLKPVGMLISVTPCMGEKPFLSGLFSIISKIGIVPQIKPFKLPSLEELFTNESFEIIENKFLLETSNQYFIVAKK